MTQPMPPQQYPVLRRVLSKSELQSLSQDEKALFLTMAHIINEINALLRAAVWSDDFSSPIKAKMDGQATLTLMFLKLLAGKLYESYQVLQSAYFGSALAKTYDSRLSADGREALIKIKVYFSHPNNVYKIRNDYAFHYSPDELAHVLPLISRDLVVYMQQDSPANNLFYFAEVVAAEALFKSIGVPSSLSALDDLATELIDLATEFAKFFGDLMGAILESLGQKAWQDQSKPIVFDQLPNFDDVYIPWFTDAQKPITSAG